MNFQLTAKPLNSGALTEKKMDIWRLVDCFNQWFMSFWYLQRSWLYNMSIHFLDKSRWQRKQLPKKKSSKASGKQSLYNISVFYPRVGDFW